MGQLMHGTRRRALPVLVVFALAVVGLGSSAVASPSGEGATLNGAAKVTVSPSASITAAVTTTSGNGNGNRVGSIGWRIATTPPGSVSCKDIPDHNAQTVTSTFPIAAPSVVGTYAAYFVAFSDDACSLNGSNTITLTAGVVVALADLSVTNTDGVTGVTAGDGVTRTYTVNVSNAAGGTGAAGVSLTDQWPSGFSRGAVTPSQGSCSGSPGFTCSLGTIGAGASATVSVAYSVPAGTTSSPQVHTVSVTTTSSETSTADNAASDSNTVATSANLSVAKSDAVSSVNAGDGVTRTFTITASNAGPSDAQSVQVSDAWPSGYTRGTLTDTHGSCSGAPSFTCNLGKIPPGASRSITVAYTVPPGTAGSQTNTATVDSTTPDPVPGNDADGDTNGVIVSADLAVTKTDGAARVTTGTSTTYTITITNDGPANVPAGVVITDPIPAGTSGSESEPACSLSGGNVVCTTPSPIAAGGSVSYEVTLAVSPSYGPATLANTASITDSAASDPTTANNSATDTDTVDIAGSVRYVRTFAGPGLADMYPVDVVDHGTSYYVVDPGRYRVVKIDRASGQVVASRGGHQGRAAGQFGAARAISVDSLGNVYVADTPNNRIQVLSPDLDFIRSWGGTGTGPGQFSMVYGVTVGTGTGADGSTSEVVYTTDGARVQKFTTTGTFISQFGQGLLNQPRQLAIHPTTHDLYVVSARDREIVVFDQDGNEAFRFGAEGTGNGQFMGDIRGIDIDDGGRVYVSDDGNHRVQVFGSNGAYLYQFGNTGSGDQYLTDARGLTVTHDGLVCVADEWDFGLKEYDINSQGTAAAFSRFLFGGPAPAPGFNSPRGIAVNESTGTIYGVDWWNQRVEKFGADGDYLMKWGQRGTTAEPGSINFAWDAAVNPTNGDVYVANRESHEIEVFDANGSYITRWGSRGTTAGRFTFPQGVAFDPTDGTLLVTDSGNGRIQRFSILPGGEGSFLTSYGTKGSAVGQFAVPTGIDVAPDGTIWVADTQNNRVQKRNPATGAWIAYAIAGGDEIGFKSPWGVNVAPGGAIWVSDTGRDRLVRMGAGGVLKAVEDETTLGLTSMDAPFEVAFGVDGRILVSVVWDNRILELAQA